MPSHYDEVLNAAPPDLGRNLDFLMNLLPMLARAGNSANPQDVFKEFVNDPQTGSFQSFADQAGLPPALGWAMELLGPDALGPAGDAAKVAPALGVLLPDLARRVIGATSKAVDAEGLAIPMFHGTNRTFGNFLPSSGGALGPGVYLDETTNTPNVFARHRDPRNPSPKDNPQIRVAYPDARNLLDLNTPEGADVFRQAAQEAGPELWDRVQDWGFDSVRDGTHWSVRSGAQLYDVRDTRHLLQRGVDRGIIDPDSEDFQTLMQLLEPKKPPEVQILMDFFDRLDAGGGGR